MSATAIAGRAMVNIFDGTRAPYSDSNPILITVMDGNHSVVSRDFHKSASTLFQELPFFDNRGDDYTFIAAADGYQDAGFFPVRIHPKIVPTVNLMLIPRSNTLNFFNATWDKLGAV